MTRYNFEIKGYFELGMEPSAEETISRMREFFDKIVWIPQYTITYQTEPRTIGKNFEPPEATLRGI